MSYVEDAHGGAQDSGAPGTPQAPKTSVTPAAAPGVESGRVSASAGRWGLPGSFWGLWAAQLINRVASFAQPFLVLYLTGDHGLSLPMAGAITGGVGVGSIIATWVGGWSADRIGRRATMLAAQGLTAGALVWLAGAHGLWQLWASALLVGLGGDLVRPAMNAAVSDVVPNERHMRAYGLLFWALNLGFAVATVGGGLLTRWGYRTLFLVNAAASVIAGLIIARAVPESRPQSSGPRVAFLPVLARDRGALALLCVGVVYSLVYFQAYSTLPALMAGQGIAPATYGAVLAVNGFVICLVQPAAVRILERLAPVRVYAVGMLVLGSGFAATAVARSPWQYAVVVGIWTLGEIAVAGVVGTLFAGRAPESLRGQYMSLVSLPFAIGAAAGPGLGALVLANVGPTWLWGGCGLVCALATPLLRTARPRGTPTARAHLPAPTRRSPTR